MRNQDSFLVNMAYNKNKSKKFYFPESFNKPIDYVQTLKKSSKS